MFVLAALSSLHAIFLRYLEDMDGSCTVTIEESLCTSPSSRLNIANYLQRRTSATNPYSPLQPVIDVENGLDKIATVLTVFQCSDSLSTDASSLSICSWDDDQSYPPSPTLSAGVCENAVIDVNYIIEYNNTNIVKITANYIFADVALETIDTETYTRAWYEDVPIPANTTANSTTGTNSTSLQTERQYMNDTVTITSSYNTVLTTRYKVEFIQTGARNTVSYSGKPGKCSDIISKRKKYKMSNWLEEMLATSQIISTSWLAKVYSILLLHLNPLYSYILYSLDPYIVKLKLSKVQPLPAS